MHVPLPSRQNCLAADKTSVLLQRSESCPTLHESKDSIGPRFIASTSHTTKHDCAPDLCVHFVAERLQHRDAPDLSSSKRTATNGPCSSPTRRGAPNATISRNILRTPFYSIILTSQYDQFIFSDYGSAWHGLQSGRKSSLIDVLIVV